jgi:hypothetical protein
MEPVSPRQASYRRAQTIFCMLSFRAKRGISLWKERPCEIPRFARNDRLDGFQHPAKGARRLAGPNSHAKSLGARWEVRVLFRGGSLGGQRHPSGESEISCLSARYPPRSQRRVEARRIASPAGIIVCSSYRQGASKVEFFFLIPHV